MVPELIPEEERARARVSPSVYAKDKFDTRKEEEKEAILLILF